jgi:polyisoprenoid-binding protein YceI
MLPTSWATDPTHSEIQFKAKHLVISTVTGTFKSFSGTAASNGDNFDGGQVTFSIDVASLDTNQEQRDGHLKSPDFFDVEKFPTINFTSTSVTAKGNDIYEIVGDLTIKDVTAPITFKAEFGGYATDFYGNNKVGFEVSGKLSRAAFGLLWNGITEAGAVVVSDEIKLLGNIQFAEVVAAA